MQYHLDTIPVWEVMEKKTECPLCALYLRAEHMEIERSLGGSVMEPDVRIRVNELGFCTRHHHYLLQQKNRLGHALLTDSHSKELLKKLASLQKNIKATGNIRRIFGGAGDNPTSKLADALEHLSQGCIICDGLQEHMNRYIYTFLQLWKKDSKFVSTWESSHGACVSHSALLLRNAQKHLSAHEQHALATSVLSLLNKSLVQNEKDLEWFTLKFDYRNQNKPWGNSKNALERTIGRLRGYEETYLFTDESK